MRPPTLFFFEIVLAIWSSFKFHMDFRIVIFIPAKKRLNGFWGWIVLNLYITLGNTTAILFKTFNH